MKENVKRLNNKKKMSGTNMTEEVSGIPIDRIAPPRHLTKEEMREGIYSGELRQRYIELLYSVQYTKLDESFLREFWDFFSPPLIFQFQNVSKDFRREFKDELFREKEKMNK